MLPVVVDAELLLGGVVWGAGNGGLLGPQSHFAMHIQMLALVAKFIVGQLLPLILLEPELLPDILVGSLPHLLSDCY